MPPRPIHGGGARKRPAIVETRYRACQGKPCPRKPPRFELPAVARTCPLPADSTRVLYLSYTPGVFRDGERRPVGLAEVAIGEDDDRHPALREADDGVTEPYRLAGMPERIAGDPPAEAILDRRVVGEGGRREREPARLLAEDPVVLQRGVPFRQVVDRCIDAAVAENSARRALVRTLPGAVHIAVAKGPVGDRGDAFLVRHRPRHAERLEDALP